MAKSIFEQKLKQTFKEKRNEQLTEEQRNQVRMKTLEDQFLQLGNKENRFIFYCPDIPLVNDLVKVIYDIAYTTHKFGFKTTILHETVGFQCKWLFELDKKYRDIPVDYIITTNGKKSKKQRNQYSFRPTDTLIVPDVFQEIFDNTFEVKLIQKALLVTGYTGLSALAPGVTYKQLGIETFIFLEEQLKNDYVRIFKEIQNPIVIEYKLDKKVFNPEKRVNSEIYPVVSISNIANPKFPTQVINIFYNLYPNLNVVSFKYISRNNYDEYVDSIKHSALHLILDDSLGFKKSALESLLLGTPVATFSRRELSDNPELSEFIEVFNRDAFEAAEFLANFFTYWLSTSTKEVTKEVELLNEKLHLAEKTEDSFENSVKAAFDNVHENRVRYFSSIKATIEKSNEEK